MSNLSDDVIKRAEAAIEPVARKVSELLGTRNDAFAVIGGTPRDNVLARVAGKEAKANDIDLIFSIWPGNLEKNAGVKLRGTNAFGGQKFYLDDVGMVDVWSEYTSNMTRVFEAVDFNCNMLAYMWPENKIQTAPGFRDFIETRTIKLGGASLNINTDEMLTVRALKFQAKFADAFGFDVELDKPLLDKIANLSPKQRKWVREFFEHKGYAGYVCRKALENFNGM